MTAGREVAGELPGELVEKDMALTAADFRRLLPLAAGDLPWRATAEGAQVGDAAGGVAIRLSPLPDRRIALITLPRLRVAFAFHGWDAAHRTAFLARFDTVFRRGGG